MDILKLLEKCELCPRRCGVNRLKGQTGYCRAGKDVKVAKAMLHMWEEPCLSCNNGSGTVFFSDCSLSCVFCQNFDISQEHRGKEISIDRLSQIIIELQEKGANNINLVSPTHYIPQIVKSLVLAKAKGLALPVVYNSNGYENVEVLKLLDGLVDVYLPDIKYYSDAYAVKYSNAKEYFSHTSRAVLEMLRQVGPPVFEGDIIKRGLIVRHLLLPGHLSESRKILDWIKDNLPVEVYVSLMCQYVPMHKAVNYPEINKKVTPKAYEWLLDYFLSIGLKNGFMQEYESAETIYTPEFNLDEI
jgi:putative pyruvate formate lyase activating enzyme